MYPSSSGTYKGSLTPVVEIRATMSSSVTLFTLSSPALPAWPHLPQHAPVLPCDSRLSSLLTHCHSPSILSLSISRSIHTYNLSPQAFYPPLHLAKSWPTREKASQVLLFVQEATFNAPNPTDCWSSCALMSGPKYPAAEGRAHAILECLRHTGTWAEYNLGLQEYLFEAICYGQDIAAGWCQLFPPWHWRTFTESGGLWVLHHSIVSVPS